jgi:integrase
MIAGTTPLRRAFAEGIIPGDPAAGRMTFTGDKVSRDILTEEETEALFRADWQDKRAYAATLVSLSTGIRTGEVRAIRRDSIGEAEGTRHSGFQRRRRESPGASRNPPKAAVIEASFDYR